MDQERALQNVIATMSIENMDLTEKEVGRLKKYTNGELTQEEYLQDLKNSLEKKNG